MGYFNNPLWEQLVVELTALFIHSMRYNIRKCNTSYYKSENIPYVYLVTKYRLVLYLLHKKVHETSFFLLNLSLPHINHNKKHIVVMLPNTLYTYQKEIHLDNLLPILFEYVYQLEKHQNDEVHINRYILIP